MAGQGVQRREVLRILGTAAAAARFPGFSKWAFACGHIGNAQLQIKPAIYRPQFFTVAEYAMVERLADIIIPSDGTPGAKEAGVAEFIDFMVANDPEVQYGFRMGLAWLNAHAEQTGGKRFVELTPAQQTSLLEPLGFKDKERCCSYFVRLSGPFYGKCIGHAKGSEPSEKVRSCPARHYRARGPVPHGIWATGVLQCGRGDCLPATERQGGGDHFQALRCARRRAAYSRGHSQTQ